MTTSARSNFEFFVTGFVRRWMVLRRVSGVRDHPEFATPSKAK
jgi:hypothetical protein